jgi:hypothetical protein
MPRKTFKRKTSIKKRKINHRSRKNKSMKKMKWGGGTTINSPNDVHSVLNSSPECNNFVLKEKNELHDFTREEIEQNMGNGEFASKHKGATLGATC